MKNKVKSKIKASKGGYRYYTVHYTPIPAEHEVVIRAKSIEEAEAKVREVMESGCESIKAGWEIDPEVCDVAREIDLKFYSNNSKRKEK